jgi:MoxR-like ATPase
VIQVLVDAPSVEDTISILRGLKERYEVHHGVRIEDAVLNLLALLVQKMHIPTQQKGGACAYRRRYSIHSLEWYKSTNSDAKGGGWRLSRRL